MGQILLQQEWNRFGVSFLQHMVEYMILEFTLMIKKVDLLLRIGDMPKEQLGR